MKQPNILVIFSDQQRWDTLGCYGQPLPLTPHLDQMANRGVRFANAFTCQPVCGPARASLQTGRYPTEIGCHINNRMLPVNEQTIANHLSASGYETAYIGKWHLASNPPSGGSDDFERRAIPPERRGGYRDFWLASDVLEFTSHSYDGHMFDGNMQRRDFPEGRYRADALTDWTLEYLSQRCTNRPFFCFLSFIEPHHQNDHNHFEGPLNSRSQFASYPVPGDLDGQAGNWREEYPDYLGCINNLDANLGRLRDGLQASGQLDNTIIIYTSDHGCHFRTRNSEYKRSCHDGCIRIPMLIEGPGFTGGKVIHELVSLIDLPSTILSAAGITPPPTMRGRSLQPLVTGTAANWPDHVFLQISESQCGRAIRNNRWKYSVRADGVSGNTPTSPVYTEDFLYDLLADPHEQHNRVRDPALASLRRELAATLKADMLAIGESEPEIRPAPTETTVL